MSILLKKTLGFMAIFLLMSAFVSADLQEETVVIDQLDLSNNMIMVSDVKMAVTKFTVIQYAGDSDSVRRPFNALKVGQEIRITFEYAHNRLNTIEKIVILTR